MRNNGEKTRIKRREKRTNAAEGIERRRSEKYGIKIAVDNIYMPVPFRFFHPKYLPRFLCIKKIRIPKKIKNRSLYMTLN